MQNCQLKMYLRDAIVSVSLLFIHKIKIAIPYFTLPERKHLNVKRRKKRQSFVRDRTTNTIYLQYNQGSYGSIKMYLCNSRVQIGYNPQYDVSCKEMLDLHPKVGKLSPNCRGM